MSRHSQKPFSGPGDLTVAIQAGGASTRMGRDKSFVPYQGRPMIEIVRDKVQALGSELIIITNNPQPYAYLQLPLFGDRFAGCGPLAGIHAALSSATFPYVLVVACDMPRLNLPLLQYLIALKETADIVVPRWNRFPEPLHAVYNKNCLPAIEAQLAAGRLKITGFYSDVTVRFVEKEEIETFDVQGLSFTNVNTPDDII
jgi:molybdopterin-guanine dinucleotide biosynthesis protein A